MTVLLVDDDRALRKLMRAYLEDEAIAVVEAGSGEEALALVERAAPALVLLDVRLPGIDGFEVLRRLEASGRAVSVILVTSVEDEIDQLVGYRLGDRCYRLGARRERSRTDLRDLGEVDRLHQPWTLLPGGP